VGTKKRHLYEPSEDLWLCALSHVIIEDVRGRSFPKQGKHMPFRPNPTKKPLIPLAQVSSPPRVDPTPASSKRTYQTSW
jgi:hypothetical protein